MLGIQYSNPPITTEGYINKPLALANKTFPYNEIADNHRFKELLYSISYTLIGKNKLQYFIN
jgi:hypothetical protein